MSDNDDNKYTICNPICSDLIVTIKKTGFVYSNALIVISNNSNGSGQDIISSQKLPKQYHLTLSEMQIWIVDEPSIFNFFC